MSPSTPSFSRLLAVMMAVSCISAQTSTYPATPLASLHFSYPSGVPYQADTNVGLIRGSQYGYNRCNSTTENQLSKCQTSFLNSIDDFCLWGPPDPNSLVANEEGEMVAWCTRPGRGTRLIPHDALQGVQFMRTPNYVQVVGFIDQTKINMVADDWGGEMDPHGADLRGNPMGGLVYSTAWSSNPSNYTQVIEWHNFMGGGAFCFKTCDPAGPNAAKFCQHIYDRIGCAYNAPNNAQKGTFESCAGDDQDFPGVYTSGGVVVTYTQPPESLGAISTMPYTAKVPSSSNCVPYASTSIYAALATVSAPSGTTSATGSVTPTGSVVKASTSAGTTGSAANPKPTEKTNEASAVAVGGIATFLGVVFSTLFLA